MAGLCIKQQLFLDRNVQRLLSSFRNCNEIKVHLINAIVSLLKSVRVNDVFTLKTILVAMLKEISSHDTFTIKPHLSEEFKLAVITCMEASTRYASTDVVEQFHVEGNCTLIARSLLVCVDIVDKEIYKTLR